MRRKGWREARARERRSEVLEETVEEWQVAAGLQGEVEATATLERAQPKVELVGEDLGKVEDLGWD